MGLNIELLGAVRLAVDGRPLSTGGPKPQALLAILTVNRRSGVAARVLIDAIWDGQPPGNAAGGLHGYLSVLRRELRNAGVDDATVLQTVANGCYLLDIADEDCDIGRFERARTAGLAAVAQGDHATASRCFTEALDEWHGDPVAGLRGLGFADRLAADLTERRLTVVLARADAETACGRGDSVTAELAAAATAHPLHEGVWQRLIRALYAAGRPGEALEAYHLIRRRLAEDLGLDTDPETDALRDAILHQRPPAAPRPPSGRTETAATDADSTAALRLPDGRVLEVPARGLRIGRDRDNDLVLDDPRVSRAHARLVVRAAGVVIHDLGSVNGVYVNGGQILGHAALTDGDLLGIGSTTLRFEKTG
ncbi:BTAD domain-containing putative transcriptional regulator [Nocardia huaxiensis]|uniref:BTAD domain-containing putative transcriptional regulator n=1 Tax=Nocardia huaxiensis TaxID=2755382 RepID=UPI001E5FDCCD|nr:BTAD domain-containing putative transcriptional regulator [Nocardia huaxiensis]UFS99370.1 FHA domain-containing protein [Nocardia huaxiensis]